MVAVRVERGEVARVELLVLTPEQFFYLLIKLVSMIKPEMLLYRLVKYAQNHSITTTLAMPRGLAKCQEYC